MSQRHTGPTKNSVQQITYRFLLGRAGERTSASEHLLLKGAVLDGVSPGEQPKQNTNISALMNWLMN